MIRRFLLIVFVLATALVLLVLQNKVLVGSQTLRATADVEAGAVEVVFRDVSGQPVQLIPEKGINVDSLVEQVRDALGTRLGDKGLWEDTWPEPIPLAGPIKTNNANNLVFELEDPEHSQAAEKRIQARSYEHQNPRRGLFHVNLGIDLRGGVEFITRLYDANNEAQEATAQEVSILRNRLDARGLTEPQVFRLSNGDVQVVIPGGTPADAAATRKVLETAGVLEFREVKQQYGLSAIREGMIVRQENGRYDFGEGINFGINDVIYPEKPAFTGAEPTTFYHLGPLQLAGEDVARAYPTMDQGRAAVGITFTGLGATKNSRFTTDVYERGPKGSNTGTGRISICFDQVVQSAPTIVNPSSKSCVITGSFTAAERDSLIEVVTAGALKRTPRILSQRVVGPSLGEQTISKAGWAMAISLLLILGGMIAYYWWRLGTVAVASLVTCIGLIFVVLSLFGATLTLPGIAGLVLTVGMAVDANILIFERLREEMKADSDLFSNIDRAYSRAFITIFDANLTTFLTALVLYFVGTGPVQGFGLTLMIGILTSMFSAIYVGRFLTNLLFSKNRSCHVRNLGELRLPYTAARKYAFALSGLLLLVGIAFFAGKDRMNDNFDIDFTGGVQVQVTFTEPLTISAVKQQLRDYHQAAPDERAILNPGRIQVLPYYEEFGVLGDAGSQQWMFKGPDERSAALEAERAELEERRVELRREADRLQEDQPSEAARIRREELQPLDRDIDKLTEQIENRQFEIRRHFRAAFTKEGESLVPAPGSQVISAAWDEDQPERLHLVLATLAPPEPADLAAVQELLARRNTISEITVRPGPERADSVAFDVTFATAPTTLEEPARTGPVGQRLLTLFGGEATPAANHRVAVAGEFYDRSIEALANNDITVNQPFPSSQSFSPQVASQMKLAALLAMLISIAAILAYIAARFEFIYGIGAIAALVHDVTITVGLLALFGVRIDLTVVAALLTIIGYSLNDTIVVFDRIRENVRKLAKPLAETIDISIAQTMSRTLLTTATTMLVVVILFFFGGEGVAAFSATLLIGLLLGTYSSIFIASPVLLALTRGRKIKAMAVDPAAEQVDADADDVIDPEVERPE
ncbi:MAG: protein translocase subunit SecD [Planctomycetota bacterium]